MIKYELSDLLEDFRRAVQNYATNSGRECTIEEVEPEAQDTFMTLLVFPHKVNDNKLGEFCFDISVWDIDQEKPQMSTSFYYTPIKGRDEPAILGEEELQLIVEIRALRRAYRSGK